MILAKVSTLPLKQVSVTLTHADLTGPIASIPLIVPAPGPGKTIAPLSVTRESNIVVPYTHDPRWELWLGPVANALSLIASVSIVLDASVLITTPVVELWGDPKSILINQPVIFAPDAGGSPPTDGDPANWVKFSVAYYEYTVGA